MATFVLVHGAWHGGWCWARVRDILQREGHQVHTPTLTGLCERSHLLNPEIGLSTHVMDVTNLIRWEGLEDVVLCGHSYGGLVISGTAHQEPNRIAALVYLDAFVLNGGQSLFATLPDQGASYLERARQHPDGWKIPPIPAAALNVNEADRDWVDRLCTPQPLRTFTEPLDLPCGLPDAARKSFIYASRQDQTPFGHFRAEAIRHGWRVSDVDCGHNVMLDRPNLLAELLLAEAQA